MTFTDEELQKLKAHLKGRIGSVGPKTVAALIERIEAAEAFIEVLDEDHQRGVQYQAWRKIAGK